MDAIDFGERIKGWLTGRFESVHTQHRVLWRCLGIRLVISGVAVRIGNKSNERVVSSGGGCRCGRPR